MASWVNWKVGREPARLSTEEVHARWDVVPEKLEWVDGIFSSDRQRSIALQMICEAYGLDRVVREVGRLEDWQAAVERRAREAGGPR